MRNTYFNIYDIISAFKTKGTVDISARTGTSIFDKVYNTFRCDSFDFSDTEFNGKIFTLNGHAHYDNISLMNNVDSGRSVELIESGCSESMSSRAVVAITTGTTMYDRNMNDVEAEINGYKMSDEFPYNFRFDIVTITETGIVCTRIGAGESRTVTY